jgi:hypothetical protein
MMDHPEEEKKYSEPSRVPQPHSSSGLQHHRSSSSSDYETDHSRAPHPATARTTHAAATAAALARPSSSSHRYTERALKNEPTFSNMSASQMTPDVAAFFDQSSRSKSRSMRDDDTYDYGDQDDDDDNEDDDANVHLETDSQGSLSYEQRRLKMERESVARAAAVAAAQAELDGPFMQPDDVEHYRQVVDTPLGRTVAGAAAAATIGCILLGPVGLSLGLAAVGIGVGYMQIPKEQRQNMTSKVTDAMNSAQESALDASDKLSSSCMASYKESGIAEHVPVEMETCCASLAGMDGGIPPSKGDDDDDSVVLEGATRDVMDEYGNMVGPKANDKRKGNTPTQNSWHRDKKEKVSCLRKGTIGWRIVWFSCFCIYI